MTINEDNSSFMYKLQFDGAAVPNPGQCAIGWVLYKNEKVIQSQSKRIGFGTNNFAEYSALIDGLQYLIDNNIDGVQIEGDSQLVIMQLLGVWKCKNPNIADLCAIARALYQKISCKRIKHIPREENKMADFYSKIALDVKL